VLHFIASLIDPLIQWTTKRLQTLWGH